jgi:Ribonuclease G/E
VIWAESSVDFIDMSNPENRKVLFDFLEEMSDDKANTNLTSVNLD